MRRANPIGTALATCLFASSLLAHRGGAAELGDIEMDHRSSANGLPPVVFPHWKHRVHFRCYACHPQPFEMREGANQFALEDIRSGRFCGACHDGQTAFAVSFDTCRTCHSGAVR